MTHMRQIAPVVNCGRLYHESSTRHSTNLEEDERRVQNFISVLGCSINPQYVVEAIWGIVSSIQWERISIYRFVSTELED